MIKSCFDSEILFFPLNFLCENEKKTILILFYLTRLLCLVFFLCYASDRNGDGERSWNIPLRTLHQKWSQLFYVSNQNLDESRNEKLRMCSRKIIGTVSKVNQNQITSKFHWYLIHSLQVQERFYDLERLAWRDSFNTDVFTLQGIQQRQCQRLNHYWNNMLNAKVTSWRVLIDLNF